ncbi:uncharacterized protein A1O9_05745 [Exophiala aquamarina CBS 119918]|uniref:Maintenance of telomere capping protein 6 n=1 Tax=Exophiala aquamarina CBS 119918 TaxID=1182545 RepID=A0A072PQQ8_9EURO|nr:uncharacterized protein A1O9_05745 [Exophiala aquamarina CBS 119918]KEF57825.1 hypothetical protein A1O9_05745 [Exophiala aquamarina CBS 119918]
MSLTFDPDDDAVPDSKWGAVYLSTRDASSVVPINFITHPAVSLTKACFADGVYDDIPAQTCISNLLALEFHRLVIDVYWDTINRQFNLCPVELPPLSGNATSGISIDVSALSSLTATTSSTDSASNPSDTPNGNGSFLIKRQSDISNTTTTPTTSLAPSITATMPTSIPTTTGVDGSTLLELGSYTCSLDLTLDSIISLYGSYFQNTSDTVSVRLALLDINLHAAAPFTSPSNPALTSTGAHLPRFEELIGTQLEAAFPRALYTPEMLQADRFDLGKSWYRDSYSMGTETTYFKVQRGVDNIAQTPDGWPGESWILLTDNRRLLVGWGQIDPQMQGYDFRRDSRRVFPSGYINANSSTIINADSGIGSTCFYQPDVFSIARDNSSWAIATINQSTMDPLSDIISNATRCGISTMLNTTLTGSALLSNLQPYRDFARAAVFGWARGEPRNASAPDFNAEGADDQYRCAVIDSTSGYLGHWRVEDCQQKRYAACRISGQPFLWRLSQMEVSFGAATESCPNDTRFDLPRTGLENTYLYEKILNDSRSAEGNEAELKMKGVWINFNSLDVEDCWTSEGPNATCPYTDNGEEMRQRNVLIPTIAALIVLILTVLTLLVKCNENRRNSRTRRRGDNGWDYEGVPS